MNQNASKEYFTSVYTMVQVETHHLQNLKSVFCKLLSALRCKNHNAIKVVVLFLTGFLNAEEALVT